MIDARSAASLGIRFGALAIAAIGLLPSGGSMQQVSAQSVQTAARHDRRRPRVVQQVVDTDEDVLAILGIL